jgi:hypothetical protein
MSVNKDRFILSFICDHPPPISTFIDLVLHRAMLLLLFNTAIEFDEMRVSSNC